ncbi:MAG: Rrf2 family transcriptional regulator [Dehalococcoidia bacterium]|nr:Rrf2 family transcriptional regulator [Dehalococcoidia bacterium]
MKLSMKGDYGIRALVDLAEHLGEGPVQSREIAERQDIPEPYLDQLLTTLRKAGFIHSRRGPQGGHLLARQPGEITLAEVVDALEGTVAAVGCLDGTVACKHDGKCGQQEVWQTLTELTRELLRASNVAGILERQQALRQRAMYYI